MNNESGQQKAEATVGVVWWPKGWGLLMHTENYLNVTFSEHQENQVDTTLKAAYSVTMNIFRKNLFSF